jgi:UDP-galactopyranose mutase
MAKNYDIIIVGAGIYGLTFAERAANVYGKKVLVLDKRDHIGGNAYSEFDAETGIEVHEYGAHLFHTNDENVWNYVTKFTDFTNYVHKVYANHAGEVFPLPVNLGTINQFLHKALTPDEARQWVVDESKEITGEPSNFIEKGISLVGRPLYEAFFMNYTAKQWQTPPEKLAASIVSRLPVRFTYDNRYFNAAHEGLPKDGYEAWFKKMIAAGGDKIEVRLGVDFFDEREKLASENPDALIIYTGPVDQYFDYKFGELSWRSLEFKRSVEPVADFQGCAVMNYNDAEPKFTRVHEFKHFHPERWDDLKYPGYAGDKTVIVREFSKTWKLGDEPYYPVRTDEDMERLEKYQKLAKDEANVIFGGRLGEYQYYDMDNTFASALAKVQEVLA